MSTRSSLSSVVSDVSAPSGARLSAAAPSRQRGGFGVVKNITCLSPKIRPTGRPLGSELDDARSRLLSLEESVKEASTCCADFRRHVRMEQVEREDAAVEHEETAAECCAHRDNEFCELSAIQGEMRRVEERHANLEEAVTSKLYWRWKESFESHMRRGGVFENFPLETFLRDVCGAVPVEGVGTLSRKVTRWDNERDILSAELTTASAQELRLRANAAALNQEMLSMRAEAKAQEAENFAWRQSEVEDQQRAGTLRAEEARFFHQKDMLKSELADINSRAECFAEGVRKHSNIVADLRAQLMTCRTQIGVAEHKAVEHELLEEGARQRFDARKQEIEAHANVQNWDVEMQQADLAGFKLRRETLCLRDQACRDDKGKVQDLDELENLNKMLQEAQREAVALHTVYRHTTATLASTSVDLEELHAAHKRVCAERERTRLSLRVAEVDAGTLGDTSQQPRGQELRFAPPSRSGPFSPTGAFAGFGGANCFCDDVEDGFRREAGVSRTSLSSHGLMRSRGPL
eukprot:TRINITY_DN76747_c0_g1_i1.p1 TRINITY_DN76747_c0_g1~~TRINITY_DN76747_c0_g1_i1.p1  ORF type:complete len:532 (-),score=79.00 TRINITY_DN76747_c0_g1_i1:107-1666(-)